MTIAAALSRSSDDPITYCLLPYGRGSDWVGDGGSCVVPTTADQFAATDHEVGADSLAGCEGRVTDGLEELRGHVGGHQADVESSVELGGKGAKDFGG